MSKAYYGFGIESEVTSYFESKHSDIPLIIKEKIWDNDVEPYFIKIIASKPKKNTLNFKKIEAYLNAGETRHFLEIILNPLHEKYPDEEGFIFDKETYVTLLENILNAKSKKGIDKAFLNSKMSPTKNVYMAHRYYDRWKYYSKKQSITIVDEYF